jgi:tetratricopeptide (TPR) repeat protein
MKQSVSSGSASNVPPNHPEVSAGEILQMFELAIKRNPNEPELLSRYGSFLFSLGRPSESVEWFQKALAIRPNDVPTLEALFDAQLDGVRDLKGAGSTLQRIEKMEPQYVALPDLRKRYEEKSKTAN